MSRIVLCLTEKTLDKNKEHIGRYRNYIDLVELRVDCLDANQYKEIPGWITALDVPSILTCRREQDGGFFTIDQESQRQEILWDLMNSPFEYVDLEMDLTEKGWEEKADAAGMVIIRSLHDFSGVPDTLESLISQFNHSPRKDILKAAVTINDSDSYGRFLELMKMKRPEPSVILAMGGTGFFSRVLSKKLGNCFCYTSAAEGETPAAPGHVDPKTLSELYRFRDIDKTTPVYGIIGNPLGHTKSPHIHNRWLKEQQLEGVYVSFPLPDIDLLKPLLDLLPIKGLSVTIPYKVSVMDKADTYSERVRAIGACNTLYLTENRWIGENTDAPGFLKPLLDRLGCADLLGRKITVIGAGGAARGIVYALSEAGAELLILNRTAEKAESLAKEFNQQWALLNKESNGKIHDYREIIVQTTNAGMSTQQHIDPLEFYSFQGDELLYDIVYSPSETKLMKRALNEGARILGGWGMLEEQARMQFRLFTRKNP